MDFTKLRDLLGQVNTEVNNLDTPTPPPPTSSTIRVPADGDLQAAIDRATLGTTILLAPGATYKGNFLLPKKDGTGFITIQTEVAEVGPLAPGKRMTPAAAATAKLATLQSPNSSACLRTAPAAHHYKFQLLQIGPNDKGYGDMILLGDGGSAQKTLDSVPYALVFDRVYVYGDPQNGQKRAFGLNSGDTQITNSTIRDIKTLGQDTQAIGGWNGPGPYRIENNYLEAAGENILFGGSEVYVPNLSPSDITIRGNHFTKPIEWMRAILPPPSNVKGTVVAGALIAGTYTYRVAARCPAGQGNMATSAASVPTDPFTFDVTGGVSLTWTAVPGASEYRVYRTDGTGHTDYWTVTQPSFTDTGAKVGTVGSAPTSGTRWTVKNVFELKNARNVLVEQNIIENNWAMAQAGWGIQLTVRNVPSGTCTWCTIQNVEIRYNIIRHMAMGFNILGKDDATGHDSIPANNINIHDNVIYDINGGTYGGNGFFVQMGWAPQNVTFDHNTIDHTGTVLVSFYGGTKTDPMEIPKFRFTNNLAKHNKYGFFASGLAPGQPSIDAYFAADGVITKNVLAGGVAKNYTIPDNLFPTIAAHMAQFVDPAKGNYALVSGSSYKGAGTDGRDLGADLSKIPSEASIA